MTSSTKPNKHKDFESSFGHHQTLVLFGFQRIGVQLNVHRVRKNNSTQQPTNRTFRECPQCITHHATKQEVN